MNGTVHSNKVESDSGRTQLVKAQKQSCAAFDDSHSSGSSSSLFDTSRFRICGSKLSQALSPKKRHALSTESFSISKICRVVQHDSVNADCQSQPHKPTHCSPKLNCLQRNSVVGGIRQCLTGEAVKYMHVRLHQMVVSVIGKNLGALLESVDLGREEGKGVGPTLPSPPPGIPTPRLARWDLHSPPSNIVFSSGNLSLLRSQNLQRTARSQSTAL
eukprot:m.330177 g.330177  ORF g.330177 m.330177 type:complete len:216 (+) comp16512_c0_seq21:2188-2835(+)